MEENTDKILNSILNSVSAYTGIPIHAIISKNKGDEFVKARQLFCYTVDAVKQHHKKKYKISLKNIGDKINIDHATVLYSIKTVNDIAETDKNYSVYVIEFINMIIDTLNSNKIERITEQVNSYLVSAVIIESMSLGKDLNEDTIFEELHVLNGDCIKYNQKTQEKFDELYDVIENNNLEKIPSLLELLLLQKKGDEFAVNTLNILNIQL